MTVESKLRTPPSTSIGTSCRGFCCLKLSSRTAPLPNASGSRVSNGMCFSASAILTFCAYGDNGCS
jgi:hypothetical protein